MLGTEVQQEEQEPKSQEKATPMLNILQDNWLVKTVEIWDVANPESN